MAHTMTLAGARGEVTTVWCMAAGVTMRPEATFSDARTTAIDLYSMVSDGERKGPRRSSGSEKLEIVRASVFSKKAEALHNFL